MQALRILGSSLRAGACAGAIGFASALGLGVDHPLPVTLLVALVTTFSYALDRAIDPGADGPGGASWVAIVSGLLWLVGVFASTDHRAARIATFVFPLSVVAYARPPFRLPRVKDIPLVKPLYVGFMWAQIVIIVALFASPVSILRASVIVAWVFLKVTVNTASCDFKDHAEDRRRGVGSWPAILGWSKALRSLQIVNVVGALPLIALATLGIVPQVYALFELLAVYFAACLALLGWRRRAAAAVAVAMDVGLCAVVLSALAIA